MSISPSDFRAELRQGVRAVCSNFPDVYWCELDQQRAYPEAFVQALTAAGYLSALIPKTFGGMGLGIDMHGGNGFVAEYDVERKFRETRMYQIAPINNNLVLAYVGSHVLGMPKSY